MNSNINFEPLGCLNGEIRFLNASETRCIETEAEWNVLWEKIWNSGMKGYKPQIDFSTRKVIHIRQELSLISNNFVIKNVCKISDDILEIHCGEVCLGEGSLGFATNGFTNSFVAIPSHVTFEEVKLCAINEMSLQELDEELNNLQENMSEAEGNQLILRIELYRNLAKELFTKVEKANHESEINEIEGLSEEQKQKSLDYLQLKQRCIKVRPLWSKQCNVALRQLGGWSLEHEKDKDIEF